MNALLDTDGLVIDLGQNRGGTNPGMDYLAPALLAEPGVMSVITSRKGERTEYKHRGGGERTYRGRVAILIDETAGSGSEVFAAGMQNKGRAIEDIGVVPDIPVEMTRKD
jgi:C-terminal processing protease CtpA/Prc